MDINELRARDARRQELRVAEAELKGRLNAQSEQAQAISAANAATRAALQAKRGELAALEVGDGAGIGSDLGPYSAIDQLLRTERFAGKAASIDAIKADPTISLADAEAAWTVAALAATGLDRIGVEPGFYGAIYRQQLHAAGRIQEATWEAQRAWIVATDKAEIMGI